jgi:hypothetical protein
MDTDARILSLNDGTRIHFGKCLLATGVGGEPVPKKFVDHVIAHRCARAVRVVEGSREEGGRPSTAPSLSSRQENIVARCGHPDVFLLIHTALVFRRVTTLGDPSHRDRLSERMARGEHVTIVGSSWSAVELASHLSDVARRSGHASCVSLLFPEQAPLAKQVGAGGVV